GNGNVLRYLESACPQGLVIGMDLFREGLQLARARTSCSLVQGDVNRSPFGKSFQLIGIFDVLKHVLDDLGVLADIHTMLAPGGTLLLTVPAHPSLWSSFVEASHHSRLYGREDLRSKLRSRVFELQCL